MKVYMVVFENVNRYEVLSLHRDREDAEKALELARAVWTERHIRRLEKAFISPRIIDDFRTGRRVLKFHRIVERMMS